VALTGAGLLGALVIGVIACGMRISRFKLFSRLAAIYIESIRSTPLLVQLFFFYFGLPSLGFRMSEAATGILALTLNSGAYLAEIIRAGAQSIPHGQIEAAISSGLNYYQRMRYVILPQSMRVILPPLVGQYVLLIKDSSVVSAIGVIDVTRVGWLTVQRIPQGILVFGLVAVLSFVICYPLIQLSNSLEKRMSVSYTRGKE
jgi:polar amino acid transport system permease protein